MADSLPVYVVDDDDAVRRSVSFMLRTAKFDVRSFDSGRSFVEAVPELPYGVVILDLRMPELDGLQVQDELARQGHRLPVIMATGHGEMEAAVQAINNGAIAFLEKPYRKEELLRAISKASADPQSHFDERSQAAEFLARLDGGERAILELLIHGATAAEIARELELSPAAVEVQKARLMEKLCARSLSDAVQMAVKAQQGQRAPNR